MTDELRDRDRLVLNALRQLGGSAAPHRIAAMMGGRYSGRGDAGVRNTLQRLERLGYVQRSSWLSRIEEWSVVE